MRTIRTAALLSSALLPCVVAQPSMARQEATRPVTDQPGGGSLTRIGRSEDMIVTADRRAPLDADGEVERVAMKPISPTADFSLDL